MSRPPQPGEQWNDRYEITAVLGRGGFGRVYRAWDPLLERDVAIKMLRPSEDFTPTDHERFRRETNIAASLEHRNIVTVYDGGEHHGLLYLVMRFVRGSDLRYDLARGPLPIERTISIITQVAAALDYAHDKGLVHRDVKPGNILCQADSDQVYLADFGISRHVDQTTDNRVTQGLAPATLAYAAPEQMQTDAKVDARVDVYALGCVLHECLTGRKPFDGEIAAMINAHLHEPPPSVVGARDDLPAPQAREWDRVIARAMAKSPAKRYQRCGELSVAAAYVTPVPRDESDNGVTATLPSVSSPTARVPRHAPSMAPPAPASGMEVTAAAPPPAGGIRHAQEPVAAADRPVTGAGPTRNGPASPSHPVDAPRAQPAPASNGHAAGPSRTLYEDRPPQWRRAGLAALGVVMIALLAWLAWPAISPEPGDAGEREAHVAGGEDPAPATGADPNQLDDAQRDLLADFGVFEEDDCRPTNSKPWEGQQVAVACASDTQAPTRVVARRFDSTAQRNAAFDALAGGATDGDCRVDSRATHAYIGEDGEGRVVCATDDSTAGLSWTLPDQPVMGSARLDDPSAAADLYRWWHDLVGRQIGQTP